MDNKLETISNLFEGKEIRSIWSVEKEDYFFSIVDAISVLTNSTDPAHYWRTLKSRMLKEGNETVTRCDTFRFKAKDGKLRLTDWVAKGARDLYERETKKSAISTKNTLNYQYVEHKLLDKIKKDDENN